MLSQGISWFKPGRDEINEKVLKREKWASRGCSAERGNQTLLYLGLAQTFFHQNRLFKIARKIEPKSHWGGYRYWTGKALGHFINMMQSGAVKMCLAPDRSWSRSRRCLHCEFFHQIMCPLFYVHFLNLIYHCIFGMIVYYFLF